jgi:hypothetical protein
MLLLLEDGLIDAFSFFKFELLFDVDNDKLKVLLPPFKLEKVDLVCAVKISELALDMIAALYRRRHQSL